MQLEWYVKYTYEYPSFEGLTIAEYPYMKIQSFSLLKLY